MAEYFINDLFESNNTAVSARSLPGTTELTNLASKLASSIIKAMEANIDEYKPRIATSATDNKELDTLIDELMPEYGNDADFIVALDSTIVNSMLKSQQSKRSRAKSKAMTVENYHTLMTAAIAERLIREKTGKSKTAGHVGRASTIVDYTIEQLEKLANDQEALKKEIRNVQSKKSIMKGKAGFDESSERWQYLLRAERQLKDLREGSSSNTVTVEVDHTQDFIIDLMGNMTLEEIEHLKVTDARELLRHIYNTVVIIGTDADDNDNDNDTTEVSE